MRTSLVIATVVAVTAAAVIFAALAALYIPTVLGGAAQHSGIPGLVQRGWYEECWNLTPQRLRARTVKGFAGWRFVEVSSEYVDAVTRVLKSDSDTAKLLEEGYNVTSVRPIITAFVSGTGEVTLRATQALVTLKGSNGTALVLVDVAQGKVLRITVVTRTVITKS